MKKHIKEAYINYKKGKTQSQLGNYEQAREQYDRVILSHPGSVLADEARYKRALTLHKLGKHASAYQEWSELLDSDYSTEARLHLLDKAFSDDEHQKVLKGLAAMLASDSKRTRDPAIRRWMAYVDKLVSRAPPKSSAARRSSS